MPKKRARWRAPVVAVLFGPALAGLVAVQPPMPTDPGAAQFIYDDIRHFLSALERIQAGADGEEILERDYFGRATPGLAALSARRSVSAGAMARSIRQQPADYASLSSLAERLAGHEPAIRKAFVRLKELLSGAVFPPTYFLISDPTFGGGLADPVGVLIALGPAGYKDVIDRMPNLVAHEMVHIQQARLQGLEQYRAIYGPSGSLLAIAIREGSADLLARLISGDHLNPRAHAYGVTHEQELWKQFQADMNGTATGDWMFRTPASPEWPQDLGYFIGYRIAEAYYHRAKDKGQAIRDILSVTDYRALLGKSGYNP